MNDRDDELDPVLGEPPAPPAGLWDRVLEAAFEAPPMDVSELVPNDLPANEDLAFDSGDAFAPHDANDHLDAGAPGAFDVTPSDDDVTHHDTPQDAGSDDVGF